MKSQMLISKNRNILISKCILGVNCRYNCGNKENSSLINFLLEDGFNLVPVCPEELGGLETPRLPSFFLSEGFTLKSEDGKDVTEYFLRGAKLTLMIANEIKPDLIIFVDKSPSCGVNRIYRNGNLIEGKGITTHLLIRNGYRVISLEDFLQIM